MKGVAYSFIVMVFFITLIIPYSSALQNADENITKKSGSAGENIIYYYCIINDNYYSIDIQLRLEDYQWEVTLIDEEVFNVQPGDQVTFRISISIPKNTPIESSNTKISFWEKRHLIADELFPYHESQYRCRLISSLTTNLNNSKETMLLNDFITNNIYLFTFFFITFITIGYSWYSRKYFFLGLFYMNIPKSKLLNNENREKISNYLLQKNGSSLSEISRGTGINLQTLRHHMKLFEHSNYVKKKDKRYFMRTQGSNIVNTEILSPILQRMVDIIKVNEGITVNKLIDLTQRSKPWVGNRIHDLIILDLIKIVKVGRYKYIYLKNDFYGIKESLSPILASDL